MAQSLAESWLIVDCHTLQKGSMFADTQAYTTCTRGPVFVITDILYLEGKEEQKLPKVTMLAFFVCRQEVAILRVGVGALVEGWSAHPSLCSPPTALQSREVTHHVTS